MTARAGALRAEGRDVIALSAGEPDFRTPSHIGEAAWEAIRSGQTKYTAVAGSPSLKEAIVAKFRRDNGLDFHSDQILISSGGKQSLYNACQVLLEASDEVILPAPYWVSFPDMVRLADAEPIIVDTDAANGFRLRPERLAEAISNRTRALIINSPCNPTGSAYARADWEALGEVLAVHPDVFIITDNGEQQFLYRATSSQVVSQEDMRLYDTGEATIHLVSCVPRLVYDHRLVITGELVAQKSRIDTLMKRLTALE